jgi:uncharacterized protein (TIGR01777 family)
VRVIIAGGTGFLGSALSDRLRHAGHEVALLTRRYRTNASDQVQWRPDGTTGPWADALRGAKVVVNLAGEDIAGGRWTAARKSALRQSRLLPTRSLVSAMKQLAEPELTLVNVSGINYYGDRDDEIVTEATPAGSDFLARLCIDWEREAEQAATQARVVILRSAPVLHPSGGALARMLFPFRLGVGGRLGSGKQYFPWIHLDDWVSLVVWAIATPEARGAFNATAPTPATNAEFTQALGRALHRPAVIPVPAFGLRLALGELAEILLTGQRAIPARAQEMGFRFRFTQIDGALEDLVATAKAVAFR